MLPNLSVQIYYFKKQGSCHLRLKTTHISLTCKMGNKPFLKGLEQILLKQTNAVVLKAK